MGPGTLEVHCGHLDNWLAAHWLRRLGDPLLLLAIRGQELDHGGLNKSKKGVEKDQVNCHNGFQFPNLTGVSLLNYLLEVFLLLFLIFFGPQSYYKHYWKSFLIYLLVLTISSSVTPVQKMQYWCKLHMVILDYDWLKDNGKISKPMISSTAMTTILYRNFEKKYSRMRKNGFNKSSGTSSCLYY